MNKDLILSRLQLLCKEKNISLNTAFIESGVGKNFKSNFKTSNPSIGKLTMLANYFSVSVDYILGETDKKENSAKEENFTEHEIDVIHAYRLQPNMQEAVDKLLGIEKDGKILLWTAAQMPANKPEEIIAMDREKWSTIEQAPETDEELK